MSRLAIAPIVEGDGEVAAVRVLLQRLWNELLGGEHIEVLRPIRRPRGKFLLDDEIDLNKAINLAVLKLAEAGGGLVLILMDAEDDCQHKGPLGPLLLERAKRSRPDADIACVIANVMYETWFVAAAESLGNYLELSANEHIPDDPETARLGKGWIKQRIRSEKYSETVDQPRLTARMSLSDCRRRSKSFDKLCRELEQRLVK